MCAPIKPVSLAARTQQHPPSPLQPKEPQTRPPLPPPPPVADQGLRLGAVLRVCVGKEIKLACTASAMEREDSEEHSEDFGPEESVEASATSGQVVELIYWRDVKRTGTVFGGLLVLLISMAFLSFISVVSYSSLTILTGTITYRVYKNIMQAVQKSQDGHPFKNFLELDTNLPADKVHEASEVVMNQINLAVSELKRLFFVEDLVDSIKFGCLLWCLTYLGSWFNGLTLVILATVAIFTLPKVYEQNKAHIDQYWNLVRTQVNDVMTKVKAAIPIGNKEKTQ